MLAVKEERADGQLIRSCKVSEEQEVRLSELRGVSNGAKYHGSNFYANVQAYLSGIINSKKGFHGKQRSKYN